MSRKFFKSEIFLNCKLELGYENLLERMQIVLFVEYQHRFFVVDGINRSKGNGTIAIGNEQSIAGNARGTLVAIRKRLDVTQQKQGQKRFLKNIVAVVYQFAARLQRFANLKSIVQRMIFRARDANAAMANATVNGQILDEQRMNILNMPYR